MVLGVVHSIGGGGTQTAGGSSPLAPGTLGAGGDAAATGAFREGCDRFQETVAAIPDLRTAARYRHPWFGPLDVAGWHAMAAFHLRLHRKQMEAILAAIDR